jgi:formylmethanofuran dehydrogenase subunit E
VAPRRRQKEALKISGLKLKRPWGKEAKAAAGREELAAIREQAARESLLADKEAALATRERVAAERESELADLTMHLQEGEGVPSQTEEEIWRLVASWRLRDEVAASVSPALLCPRCNWG